jgi:hypothetical protein
MPVSLRRLLTEALEHQADLVRRSWQIENQAQLDAVFKEALAMRERLFMACTAPFSAEAQKADRLALTAELAELEESAAAERSAAEAAHSEELAEIALRLERERVRIAKSQTMLDAMT